MQLRAILGMATPAKKTARENGIGMTGPLYWRVLSRLLGGVPALTAIGLAVWLDGHLGTHIMDRRPWMILVIMIAIILALIVAVPIYRTD